MQTEKTGFFRRHTGLLALLILIGLLLAIGGGAYWYFQSKLNLMQRDDGTSASAPVVPVDESASDVVEQNSQMQEITAGLEETEVVEAVGDIVHDENVFNILLIGTDERTKNFNNNARGDSCMLLSVNKQTKAIHLFSLERGMGMPIPSGDYAGQWDWLTHLFRYGGGSLMVEAVRENFKIDVNHYIRVNFSTFEAGIDAVGGVDIDLTAAEAAHFRSDHNYPAVTGTNHLDGYMALQYARLRVIDSDWVRITRQRAVIQAAINQVRSLSLGDLDALLNSVLPLVQTNLTDAEITSLMLDVPGLIGADMNQMTLPAEGTFGSMVGMGGRSMFAVDFEANAALLKELLYGIPRT